MSVSLSSIFFFQHQESKDLPVAYFVCQVPQISAVEETCRSLDNKLHDGSSPLAKVHLLTCSVSSSSELMNITETTVNVIIAGKKPEKGVATIDV